MHSSVILAFVYVCCEYLSVCNNNVRRTSSHKNMGAREPQSSKLNWEIMYKVFVFIVLFIQSCAN